MFDDKKIMNFRLVRLTNGHRKESPKCIFVYPFDTGSTHDDVISLPTIYEQVIRLRIFRKSYFSFAYEISIFINRKFHLKL